MTNLQGTNEFFGGRVDAWLGGPSYHKTKVPITQKSGQILEITISLQ